MRKYQLLCVPMLALLIGGCAVGFKQDGTPVIGVNAGEPDIEQAERIAGEAGDAAGAIFGPQAGIMVDGIAGVALALGGLLYGKREGRKIMDEKDKAWDEAKAEAKAESGAPA